MTYKLYLDDTRFPPDDSWTLFRDADEAKAYILEHGIPYEWSFDHDLGLWKDTGYDFVKWLIYQYHLEEGNPIDLDIYDVHSANPVGVQNIIGLIEGFKKSLEEK